MPTISGLRAYYPLDLHLYDLSGNAYNLSLGATRPQFTKQGRVGGCAQLTASSSLEVTTPLLYPSGSTTRSLSLWFKATAYGTIYKEWNTANSAMFTIAITSATQITVTCLDSAGATIYTQVFTYAVSTSSPINHLALVDNNGATITLYVNGASVGVVSAPPGAYSLTCSSSALGAGNFAGLVDEVAAYNVALSGANVTSLYSAPTRSTSGSLTPNSTYTQSDLPCRASHIFGGGQRSTIESVTEMRQAVKGEMVVILEAPVLVQERDTLIYEGKRYDVTAVQDAGGMGQHHQVFVLETK